MNQTESELVIEWYLDLEARLKHYLKIVPITWNYKAVLPLLSGIIVEAAGLVDSVFRKEFDLSQSKTKRKDLRITHFSAQYEQRYSLSSKTTLIYQYPPILLNPFLGWTSEQKSAFVFDWWDGYNKLKHERIEHYSKSTLQNAVAALCALHQVLSVLPCFFKSLIAHDMIALRGYAIPYAIQWVDQGRPDIPFLLDSELFATPYGQSRFPDDPNKISSEIYGGSKRLAQFLGR